MAIDNIDALITQGFHIPTAVIGKKTASSIGLVKTKKLLKANGKKSITIIHSNDVDDFLEHFGILGMHWGIRKRPERLTANKTDTAITKQVKNDYNKLTGKDFLLKYATTKGKYSKRVEKFGDPFLHRINQTKDQSKASGLTPDERVLAIYGGAIAVSVLAAVGQRVALHLSDSGVKDAKRTGDKPFKQNNSLKGKKSVVQLQKDVASHINPGYGAAGTKMNCRRGTMAYEMRRRGYDVKATKSNFATGQTIKGFKKVNEISRKEHFDSVWGETQVSNKKTFARMSSGQKADAVFSSISKYPNGSRGEIGSAWIFGGGHSMAFEIVNHKPVIFDTQNNKVYRTPKDYSKFTATTLEVAHTRTDNRTIDNELIKRWVTDV